MKSKAIGVGLLVLTVLAGCRRAAEPVGRRVSRLEEELAATYRRGTAEEATAAVREAIAAGSDFEVAMVGFDRDLTDSVLAVATPLWRETPTDGSGIRLLFVGYHPAFGNAERHRWWAFGGSILPHRLDGRTCAVALPLNDAVPGSRISTGATSLRNVMSPCLFWRRYGAPGRGTMAWLEKTGFRPLALGGWLDNPNRVEWRQLANPFASWSSFSLPDGPAIGQSPWSVVGVLARLRQPPYLLGAEFVRCLAGRSGACEGAALAASDDERSGTGLAARNRYWWPGAPEWEYWIGGLIHYQGNDRFARLWKSDADFPVAFREAYGVGLDEGVRQWAEAGIADREPIRIGVTLPSAEVLAGTGWVLLLAMLVVAGSRRRPAAG